jgi:hypothetical protein
MSELSSLLSFIALIVSLLVGVGTLRQRVNEPSERRWTEFFEWKKEVDEKLGRDYRAINRAEQQIERHHGFEHIVLVSMKGLLNHLAEGNHAVEMKKISNDIDAYLLTRHDKENKEDSGD